MVTKYFDTPFANSGNKTSIPDVSQPSGDVSFEDGWTPDYEKDQATDPSAKDISRQSENYFKFVITEAMKEIQEQGFKPYSNLVNYSIGAVTPGSDNELYYATAANGPGSTVKDPVTDITGTWIPLIDFLFNAFTNGSLIGIDASGNVISIGPGTAGQVAISQGPGLPFVMGNISAGEYDAYARFEEQQSSGVAGGTGVSATWNARTLNTEVEDDDNIASLSGSNVIIAAAGTYKIKAISVVYGGNDVKNRIYNVSDAGVAVTGFKLFNNDSTATGILIEVTGTITIAGPKTLRIDTYTNTGRTNGLGWSPNPDGSIEVYNSFEIWRKA